MEGIHRSHPPPHRWNNSRCGSGGSGLEGEDVNQDQPQISDSPDPFGAVELRELAFSGREFVPASHPAAKIDYVLSLITSYSDMKEQLAAGEFAGDIIRRAAALIDSPEYKTTLQAAEAERDTYRNALESADRIGIHERDGWRSRATLAEARNAELERQLNDLRPDAVALRAIADRAARALLTKEQS